MSSPQYSTAFGKALLTMLGYPVTSYNLKFLQTWANREGTKAKYNPFATTQGMPGSHETATSKHNVQDYVSLDQGVRATVKTLMNGRYADLLIALKTGVASTTEHYKGLATWSGGGYDNLAGVSSKYTPGGAAGAGSSGKLPKASSQGMKPADYAAQVGYSLAVINSDPSLKALFAQAEAGNWNSTRWAAAVKNTPWYRRQNDAQRAWYILSREDPQTAADRITQRLGQIQQVNDQLGAGASSTVLHDIALRSLQNGLNDQQIRYLVGQAFRYDPTKAQYGLAGTAQDAIHKAAGDYAIPVSQAAMQQWETQILEGGKTPDDFTEYAKQMARSTYGEAVGKAIDAGVSVRTYMDPYAQLAAQNGVTPNPDAIDWTDPMWNQVIKPRDPATGTAQANPLSLDDAVRLYRTDQRFGYDTSGVANASAAQFGNALAQRMGAVA